jgi:hypothetical protein
MTRLELNEYINATLDNENPIGLSLHVVLKENDEEIIREADISNEVEEQLLEQFSQALNSKYINNEGLNYSNISQGEDLKNSAFYYDIDEIPEELNTLNGFDEEQDYDDFSFTNDDVKRIRGVIISIGNQERKITLFQYVYPISIVSQGKFIGIFPSETRFELLEDNILKVGSTIDLMLLGDNLIVNSLKTFTSKFGFKDIIKRKANQNLDLVDGLGLIENIQLLRDFIEDTRHAKKILKLNPNSPVLNLPAQGIWDFIRAHPILQNRIRFNDDTGQINLDTDVSKALVIGVLNDDYLKSNLTNLDYETEIKREFIDEE